MKQVRLSEVKQRMSVAWLAREVPFQVTADGEVIAVVTYGNQLPVHEVMTMAMQAQGSGLPPRPKST